MVTLVWSLPTVAERQRNPRARKSPPMVERAHVANECQQGIRIRHGRMRLYT
jgi:hypothetical protein